MTQQNKLSHNCLLQDPLTYLCVCCEGEFSYSVSRDRPFKSMKGLNKVKADERRKLRERTEARVAQLERQQARQNWTEVLDLCALLWVALIVCFYARLYLSQYRAH